MAILFKFSAIKHGKNAVWRAVQCVMYNVQTKL